MNGTESAAHPRRRPTIKIFLLSLAVGLSGAVVPGPLFAIALERALLVGWTAGLWLSTGHIIAELALAAVMLTGLEGLFRRRRVIQTIGFIGGLVLLYIARDMIATALGDPLVAAQGSPSRATTGGALIGQGLVLTLVNPYWYLWWATAGIGLIISNRKNYGPGTWPAFFVGHGTADLLWYVTVSALIAFGGAFFDQRLHQALIFGCGIGVAVLGLTFIQQALRRRNGERVSA